LWRPWLAGTERDKSPLGVVCPEAPRGHPIAAESLCATKRQKEHGKGNSCSAYFRKTTMQRLQQKSPSGETTKEKLKQLWSKFSDTVRGKKLYHCTSEQNAESIESSGFRPGSRGIAGGGIYFAETPADALRKAHCTGAVLKCRVKLGQTLDVGYNGDSSLNLSDLKEKGYDSVRIPRLGTEYCVYEPSRVRLVGRITKHPLVHLQRKCSQCDGGDAGCFFCMGTGIVDYYEDAARLSTAANRY
jgi:hypothetical protein